MRTKKTRSVVSWLVYVVSITIDTTFVTDACDKLELRCDERTARRPRLDRNSRPCCLPQAPPVVENCRSLWGGERKRSVLSASAARATPETSSTGTSAGPRGSGPGCSPRSCCRASALWEAKRRERPTATAHHRSPHRLLQLHAAAVAAEAAE
jgi:hypothetical protein